MPRTSIDKRVRLAESATELSYRQGFERTTLAHIARASKVPLGNIHYYFKTKEEIGEAVLSRRSAEFQAMRERWSLAADPKARLLAFVEDVFDDREVLARSGCRIGTLSTELNKSGGALAKKSRLIFRDLLAWLEAQFHDLGKGADAAGLALHALSVVQGVSVLANAFRDPGLIALETDRLRKWIEEL